MPDGEVLVAARRGRGARARARSCATAGVEAVAVCLLHSLPQPRRTSGGSRRSCSRSSRRRYLSVSHEVLPLYREFERFSTVAPERLRRARRSRATSPASTRRCASAGFAHGVQLMQSSGGMATVESAAQRPVNLLMSGPVAGLIGGIWAGRMAGYRERRHARHRRHLGRHRRRRRRPAAHAPPARHEGRRLPGDGADGRHRHDRRRRRLDRLRRRGRRLPRRPAVGGRRPRARLLRPRRRRADLDRRPAAARPPARRTAACSAAACSSTVELAERGDAARSPTSSG